MEKRQHDEAAIFYTRKCAVCNVIIWILLLILIMTSVISNSMSHYRQSKFEKVGIIRTDSSGYFECGWGEYSVQIEQDGDIVSMNTNSWHYGDAECHRLTHNQNNICEWTSIPDNSGLIWCICNIFAAMMILMGILLHILSIFDNKLTYMLYNKRRVFKIICLISLLVGISILFGIFYWFNMNTKHAGCWNDFYEYIVDEDVLTVFAYNWYQFEDKQLGVSIICDICALSMIWIFVVIYCFLSCKCSNKSTRFIKGRVRKNIQNEKAMMEMLDRNLQEAQEYEGEVGGKYEVDQINDS